MLSLISPAKSLNFDVNLKGLKASQPLFKKQTAVLANILRGYSASKIKRLMGISDKLAELNFERYQQFSSPGFVAKPAISVFNGDVYRYLDVTSLNAASLDFLSQHAAILSGLYGLLRPTDLMQAYRLEMGSKLPTEQGKNLYEFWGDKITQKINSILAQHKNPCLLNLASNEYITALQQDKLKYPCIDVQFKVKKDGKYKVIGIEAKRARGAMLRAIAENKIDKPEDLFALNINNYKYKAGLSQENIVVFARN